MMQYQNSKMEQAKKRKAEINNKTGGVAIGYYVISSGENALALGRQSYAREKHCGNRSVCLCERRKRICFGIWSKSLKEQRAAIGSYTRTEGKNSITLGVEAKVLNHRKRNWN